MRVCILTTVDSPSDPRVFHKEAKSLVKSHDVVVIAPSDETTDEVIEGIRVITVRKPANKILHVITLWRILREALKQECDVCHCHAPGGLFLGALLKILKRSKVVYDAREHYSSLIAENTLFPNFIRPLVRLFADIEERVLVKFADVIITVDEILASKYRKHHDNVVKLSNYPKLTLFGENGWSDDLESRYGKSKVLLYAGGLTKDRGTLESIQALQEIIKKAPEAKLAFLGEFKGGSGEYKEEVHAYIKKTNLERYVDFLGYVPHEKVVEYMNIAKVCTLFLQPIPRYKKAVSIKLFEYMACGKPVVASNFTEIRKVVKEADCGILVDPTNVDEIANAILYLLEHLEEAKRMGENGRRAVEEKYNWEKMEEKLLKLYEGL